jgi:predicted O-methyltransferase YrrM
MNTGRGFWEELVGDRHVAVRQLSDFHRETHGCDAFPTSRLTAALVQWLIRARGTARVVELGTGLGYLSLHIADALAPGGSLDSIERDPVHAEIARQQLAGTKHAPRVSVRLGDIEQVLDDLEGEIDLAVDDAWFIHRPPWLDSVVARLAPGGILVQTNWFALDVAVRGGDAPTDWPALYGAGWPRAIMDYARELSARRDISATWIASPALMLIRRLSPSG